MGTLCKALIDERDPLGYGWKKNNGNYFPATAANAFAPSLLVELISCNCMKYRKKSFLVIQIGEIALTFVDVESPVKIQTFHYPEQYLMRISNFKTNLVNIQ